MVVSTHQIITAWERLKVKATGTDSGVHATGQAGQAAAAVRKETTVPQVRTQAIAQHTQSHSHTQAVTLTCFISPQAAYRKGGDPHSRRGVVEKEHSLVANPRAVFVK